MTLDKAIEWLQHHADNTPMPGAREAYKTILEALDKTQWISGSVEPKKVGDLAVCLDGRDIIIADVISYKGKLCWEDLVYGWVFVPDYWIPLPELPRTEQ